MGALSAQVPPSWSPRGVGAGGALYVPAINPANDNEVYVACDMSDLFHTTDFGASYSVVPFTQVQAGPNAQVQFTSDPKTAYALSYAGNNVAPVKTVDGGVTWNPLSGNPLPYDDAYSIWADYANPLWVVVAGYSTLYFSSDGGSTFTPLSVTIDPGSGALVGGAYFDGSRIFLGTSAGLMVSSDSGKTFTNRGNPGIGAGESIRSFAGATQNGTTRFFCLTVANAYPGQYATDYYGDFRNIYSMDNETGNWVPRSTGLSQASDYLMFIAMAANDINTVYAGGSTDLGWGQVPEVVKTTTAGASWTNVFEAANNQNIATGWIGRGGDRDWTYGEVVFGLAVSPVNASKVFVTDEGSAHESTDGGANWQEAYVSRSDEHPEATTQIAGSSYTSDGLENTSSWQVSWADAQTVLAGFSDIHAIRSVDAGATWSLKLANLTANSTYRIVVHPTNGSIYAATSNVHDLYESTHLTDATLDGADSAGAVMVSADKGATWSTLHAFGHPVFWIALDPSNSDRMYASVVNSTHGGIYVTNDLQDGASAVWTALPAPPRTQGHPASLVVLADGSVLASFSGRIASGSFTASSGVFLYAASKGAWTDVSDPGMLYWTRDVVIDPSDGTQGTWYAGVFSGWGGPPNGLGGLYVTTNRGAKWTRISALDRVSTLTFNPANPDDAYMTTEVDGLWHTSNLHSPNPTFAQVANYAFRHPQRVFFNPYNAEEVWVTSFGNGLAVGNIGGTVPTPTPTPTPSPTPTPTPPTNPASCRLVNLSVRSTAAAGSQSLIGGFVIGGSGSKDVLLRGDGPALAAFGVAGALPDPVLSLYSSGASPTEIASNAGWGGGSTLASVFSQVGAFSLDATSKDAALLQTLGSGAYTGNISSTNSDTGVALVEIYDADTGTPTARFTNLSARCVVGTGSQTLIAGFVVSGSGTDQLLIRASGPALASFGVSGVLPDPQLQLFQSGSGASSTLIASNAGWGGSAPISAAAAMVGAFSWGTAATPDSALLVSLAPGAYTAEVTGLSGDSGVALVEIYEVP